MLTTRIASTPDKDKNIISPTAVTQAGRVYDIVCSNELETHKSLKDMDNKYAVRVCCSAVSLLNLS